MRNLRVEIAYGPYDMGVGFLLFSLNFHVFNFFSELSDYFERRKLSFSDLSLDDPWRVTNARKF